jgi:hypothetical protein
VLAEISLLLSAFTCTADSRDVSGYEVSAHSHTLPEGAVWMQDTESKHNKRFTKFKVNLNN